VILVILVIQIRLPHGWFMSLTRERARHIAERPTRSTVTSPATGSAPIATIDPWHPCDRAIAAASIAGSFPERHR